MSNEYAATVEVQEVSQVVEETQPILMEVPVSTVHLVDSYIRIAAKNKKGYTSKESAIQALLTFGVEEMTRRETRLAVQHAKDAYFKEKMELDKMFATLKGSKSPMSIEDYFERMKKIEARHGIGFSQSNQ